MMTGLLVGHCPSGANCCARMTTQQLPMFCRQLPDSPMRAELLLPIPEAATWRPFHMVCLGLTTPRSTKRAAAEAARAAHRAEAVHVPMQCIRVLLQQLRCSRPRKLGIQAASQQTQTRESCAHLALQSVSSIPIGSGSGHM